MESAEKVIPIGIALTPRIIRGATIVAALEGKSRSAFIREAVDKALDERAAIYGSMGESREPQEMVDGQE